MIHIVNQTCQIVNTYVNNRFMNESQSNFLPADCPVCHGDLHVVRLQCPVCGTEVAGNFTLSRLASLPEPHASLIELFLRVRGNVKDMERALGLSYPTVRARLEEALVAAGLMRTEDRAAEETALSERRSDVLDQLERGEIGAAEAAERLRVLKKGRSE